MSNPKTTHIIENYPEIEDEVMVNTPVGPKLQTQKRPSQSILYRASDGMCIGARQATVVSVGPDQKDANMRTFMDEMFAQAFLRKFADDDARHAWINANQILTGESGVDEWQKEYNTVRASIEEIDCTEKVQKAKLARPSLVDISAINRSKQ